MFNRIEEKYDMKTKILSFYLFITIFLSLSVSSDNDFWKKNSGECIIQNTRIFLC